MPDDRTIGETNRRIDQLAGDVQAFRSEVNARLDKMPTADLLLAYMRERDTRISHLEDDVKEIRAESVGLRAEHDAEIEKANARTDALRDEIGRQRRFSQTLAISLAGLVLSVIGTVIVVARFTGAGS
jgi:outer membrane murein-binding lipoprotein Lpp